MSDKYNKQPPTELTQELKISFLDCALQLQGVQIARKLLDKIIVTYELVIEKQGNFTLGEGLQISESIEKKYNKKDKQN